LADIFNTSVDYIINGTADEKAKASLEIIGAYIRDFKTKQAYLL